MNFGQRFTKFLVIMKAQHRDLTCVYSGTAIALADDHRGYSKLELLAVF